jgi:hypothetical protein
VSAAVAVAIWFVPWLAFVVLAFTFGMTVLASVVRARAKTLRIGEVAYSVAFSTVFLGVVLFYPRAAALVPVILAVRFAISGGENDSAWESAKQTVRFDTPYR